MKHTPPSSLKDILDFSTNDEKEAQDKSLILNLLEVFGEKLLTRDLPFAHLTASGFILNKNYDQCLMVHHNIYKSWSWTGGHADGTADLLAVAIKEAQEETGISDFLPVSKTPISIDVLPVHSHYKNNHFISAHIHLSVSYLLIADNTCKTKVKTDENSGVKWVSIDEISTYSNEMHMLPIYEKIIQRALKFKNING